MNVSEMTNEDLLDSFRAICDDWKYRYSEYEPIRAELLRRLNAEPPLQVNVSQGCESGASGMAWLDNPRSIVPDAEPSKPRSEYPLPEAGPFWHDLSAMLAKHNVPQLYEPLVNAISAQFFPAERQEGWVSVKERLPEYGQMVLMWFVTVNPANSGIVLGTRSIHEPGKYWDHGRLYRDFSRISHWRPLPDPPSAPAPPEDDSVPLDPGLRGKL